MFSKNFLTYKGFGKLRCIFNARNSTKSMIGGEDSGVIPLIQKPPHYTKTYPTFMPPVYDWWFLTINLNQTSIMQIIQKNYLSPNKHPSKFGEYNNENPKLYGFLTWTSQCQQCKDSNRKDEYTPGCVTNIVVLVDIEDGIWEHRTLVGKINRSLLEKYRGIEHSSAGS